MAEFVYVDNSNVFIEGKRVAAVEQGMAMDILEAMNHGIIDNSYRIDFGKLHSFVAGNDPSKIRRAVLFGSRPPQNDSLWNIAKSVGFEVIVEDRNVKNKEKKIDTAIVAAMTKDAYTQADKDADIITLVAGDKDYVPAIKPLVADGFKVDVVFWNHAATELKEAASEFINLNPHLNNIRI